MMWKISNCVFKDKAFFLKSTFTPYFLPSLPPHPYTFWGLEKPNFLNFPADGTDTPKYQWKAHNTKSAISRIRYT